MKEIQWDTISVMISISHLDDCYIGLRARQVDGNMLLEVQGFDTMDMDHESEEFIPELEIYSLPLEGKNFFSALLRPEFMKSKIWNLDLNRIETFDCVGLISPLVLLSELTRDTQGIQLDQLLALTAILRLNGRRIADFPGVEELARRLLENHVAKRGADEIIGIGSIHNDQVSLHVGALSDAGKEVDINGFTSSWIINRFADHPAPIFFEAGDLIEELHKVREAYDEDDEDQYESEVVGQMPPILAHFTIAGRWLYLEFEEMVEFDGWDEETGQHTRLEFLGWRRKFEVLTPEQFYSKIDFRGPISEQERFQIEFELSKILARIGSK